MFCCCLFKDAVSLYCRLIANNELENIVKEAMVAQLKVVSLKLHRGSRNTTKNRSEDIICHVRKNTFIC